MDDGLRVANSSQAFASSSTTLAVRGSGSTGIEVADGSHLGLLGTTEVSGNGATGIAVVDVSDDGLFGDVQIFGNARSGLVTTQNSNVDGENLMIMNNGGAGLFADFSSVDINRSTLTQNMAGDIILVQGTRADLTEPVFGTFTCDASVFLSGDTGVVCRAAPPAVSVR